MAKEIKIRLKDTDAFRKWQRLNQASKAVKMRLESLAKQAGLPESKQFKHDCKGYFVDGNNNPLGKFSVFSKGEFVMPACKVCRIS